MTRRPAVAKKQTAARIRALAESMRSSLTARTLALPAALWNLIIVQPCAYVQAYARCLNQRRHCTRPITVWPGRLPERYLGRTRARTTADVNQRATQLIHRQPRPVRTVTADNGTEFHGYATIEQRTGTRFYFATPHHAWERGTNENTNGLLRQYLPKKQSMAHLTQHDCNRIATQLNTRPRKRLGYRTPEEYYEP